MSFTDLLNTRKFYVLLLGIVLLVYANSIFNGYNYDDTLVTQNQPLTAEASFSSIHRIFTGSYYKDSIGHSFGYRPMVLLSFVIEHALLGESPLISHAINVLLYLGSVLLLFSFLKKLIGEEKTMIALVAALLFAVHPVHSEVVASIKNRDEILAFVFAVSAGLMAIKFMDKKRWYNLFFCFILFSTAMLSKKSVFPLSVFFPISFVLLKEINWKELFWISISVVIPGAFIGSDFELSRFIILVLISLSAIAGAYLIINKIKNDTKKLVAKAFLPGLIVSMISWGIIGLSFYKDNFNLVFLSILLMVSASLEYRIVIFQMLLQLLCIGYYFNNSDSILLAFLIGCPIAIYSLTTNKADLLNILIVLLAIIGFVNLGDTLNAIYLVGFVVLFYYVSIKNAKWSLILAAVNLILSLLYFQVGLFQIGLTIFAVIINIDFLKKIIVPRLRASIGGIILLSMIYISFEGNYANNLLESLTKTSGGEVENIQTYLKNLSKKTEITEGRRLEFMENTLVAPHTPSETVATGFAVLGEYARLMLFPKELSFYYGYSKIKTSNFNDYKVWISLIFYLLLIVIAFYFIDRRPLISFGIGWFIISILLFSNWVELVAGMVGERLAFTASAGFSVLIAAVIYELKSTFNLFRPRKMEFVVMFILLLFSIRTYSRNREWEGPITLMTHDIVHLENSAQANNMLALSLMNESMTNNNLSNEVRLEYQRKAENYFTQAIAIYPYFFNYQYDLGRTYVVLHELDNAKKSFLEAYKLQPQNLLALNELTRVCFDLGHKEDTVHFGNLYLEIDPYNEKIHEFVSYICLLNKDFESTKIYAERGLSYFPDNENFKHMIIDSSN